jgi:hypothetical protein
LSALEFISSIAWPITVLVIAALFRRPITFMLSGQLKSLKAGPVEAVWHEAVSEVREDLPSPSAPPGTEVTRAEEIATELASLAERSPAAAVLEGYSRIERELRTMLANPPVDIHLDLDRLGAPSLANLAVQRGRLNPQTAEAMHGLNVLRNLAAHGQAGDLTAERALEYLDLVDAVLLSIRLDRSPVLQGSRKEQ